MPQDKIDLKDNTFVIPVRIETIERLENLKVTTETILRYFETNIIVLEAAAMDHHLLENVLPPEVQLHFVEDRDPIFHRTRYLNRLTGMVKTPFIAVWDSDVIVPIEQIALAVRSLRKDEADFTFPYDGMFMDTGCPARLEFMRTRDMSCLLDHLKTMKALYGYNACGGGFFANISKYREAGLENENFYYWGQEDGERVKRWEILEMSVKRVVGPMFHFSHPRGINSGVMGNDTRSIVLKEFLRITRMSREELQEEISNWKHVKNELLSV